MELSRLLSLAALVYPGVAGGIYRDLNSIKSSYDYVIAGGGLSGLVLANRLSEDARCRITPLAQLFDSC